MVVAADSVKMDPQALRRVEDLFHQQIHQGTVSYTHLTLPTKA